MSALKVGDTVRLKGRGRMTVRAISKCSDSGNMEARLDDGNPADDDLKTNGWTYATWEPVGGLEVCP